MNVVDDISYLCDCIFRRVTDEVARMDIYLMLDDVVSCDVV